jgi:hypothetical protein
MKFRNPVWAVTSNGNNHKKSYPRVAFFMIAMNYLTSINSTSKIKVASGGITPPAPLEPYPK